MSTLHEAEVVDPDRISRHREHRLCGTYNGLNYGRQAALSFTGMPETTDVRVVCNAADAGMCTDWFIEPIAPGPAIARLMRQGKPGKANTHIGTFRVRFRIHITRP
jgi:hypothetical protein